MELQTQYKYFAFISYNSHDIVWGKRIQRKLESYKMSATLCSEHGWKRKPINPVFFAPYDIQPGGLTEELQERLKVSRNLIVICSPNSAQSEWVGKEIEYFYQLGRTKNIHFFIVDGEPHSGNPDTECFNPIVETLGLPEILGANIHEQIFRWSWLNKERAYVQLISKLLGVEFDTIWQRHKRQLVWKLTLWSVAMICVLSILFGVYRMNLPMDVQVCLNEMSYHNENMPPLQNASITLHLDNEKKEGLIVALDSSAVLTNIPHRYLNQVVRAQFQCKDYMPMDTLLQLTERVILDIYRDSLVYGDIKFQIWNNDAQGVPNVAIRILEYEVISDENGYVSLYIPLEKQQNKYNIDASIPMLKNIISMPCGDNAVLRIK